MVRGCCLATDQETGQMCGRGMATYIDLAPLPRLREALLGGRGPLEGAGSCIGPQSSGDRLALRVYGSQGLAGDAWYERTGTAVAAPRVSRAGLLEMLLRERYRRERREQARAGGGTQCRSRDPRHDADR